ncbi:SGNH/GDSL hydrolase family protein [Paenibacillus allorhizosphaerae]|uniref:Acetylxylan esterase n=1 Tax=Paenibacillus allorhizosphaerae TaxID=2849866 RepID=A0ABN7TYG4_9BACL|nr:SGNH/GDSL hydrolase family protein [Paenibacillus allorhizosphaerae]CAG7655817.1 Acetylxylan esterase [Paenibacillus allorhizosphaerae]
MLLQQKDKLVMIGDSITDCGRKKPEGEGRTDALGNGYVSLVNSFLQSFYPELGIRVVNMGISGNTVRDLNARWQTDVIDQKPDWLSIMIGINDVWRQYDLPQVVEKHVYIEEYERTLRELVERTKPSLKGLILMTPFYIEPNADDLMRAAMDKYGEVVRKVAAEHQAVFVDTQKAFAQVLEHIYPATLAWDRVHPSMTGHMTLAKAFLNAIGFSWNGDK